jgi:uncharacterized protein (UPF0332 family)
MLKDGTRGYLEKAQERLETAEYSLNAHRYNMVITDTYYYVFNLCRAILFEEFSDTTTKHKTLISSFNRIMIHERSQFPDEFGRILNTLAKERDKCDYEANYHIDPGLAAYLYQKAVVYGNMLKEYVETGLAYEKQSGPDTVQNGYGTPPADTTACAEDVPQETEQGQPEID